MLLETTVLGGLPCIAEMAYQPPDPSVGYFEGYWTLENVQIRPGEYADWIERQLTEADIERLGEEAEQKATEGMY